MRRVLYKNRLPGPVYITESENVQEGAVGRAVGTAAGAIGGGLLGASAAPGFGGMAGAIAGSSLGGLAGDRLEDAARKFFSRKKKNATPAITEAEKDDERKFKKGDVVTCTPEIMIRRSNVDKYVGKVVGFDEERGQYEVEYKDGDRMFVGEDDLRKWRNPWKGEKVKKVDEGIGGAIVGGALGGVTGSAVGHPVAGALGGAALGGAMGVRGMAKTAIGATKLAARGVTKGAKAAYDGAKRMFSKEKKQEIDPEVLKNVEAAKAAAAKAREDEKQEMRDANKNLPKRDYSAGNVNEGILKTAAGAVEKLARGAAGAVKLAGKGVSAAGKLAGGGVSAIGKGVAAVGKGVESLVSDDDDEKSKKKKKGRVDEGAGAGYTIDIKGITIGEIVEIKADDKEKDLYVFAAKVEPCEVEVSAEDYYNSYCNDVSVRVDGGMVRGVVEANDEDDARGLLEEAFDNTPVDMQVSYGFGWIHVNLPEDGNCAFDYVSVKTYLPYIDIFKANIDSKEMSDTVNQGCEDANNFEDNNGEDVEESTTNEAEDNLWYGETKCNICGKDCDEELVYGTTSLGPMAVMCPDCAKTYALRGGQTYKRNKDDEFVKECDQTTPIGEADEGTLGDEILAVYDGGDKYFDRYTIVLKSESKPGFNDCLCLSSNPDSPQGFSQFSSCQDGDHLGKPIDFNELPEKVRVHAMLRLTPDEDEGGGDEEDLVSTIEEKFDSAE